MLELSAVGDDYLFGGGPTLTAEALHLLDDVHAVRDAAEHHMFAVQPGSFHGAQEELGSVGAGASVSHGQDACAGVLELEVFVLKLIPVDGFPSGAVMVGKVSPLAHEVCDHAVEAGTFVTKTFFSRTECPKVLCGLWHNI